MGPTLEPSSRKAVHEASWGLGRGQLGGRVRSVVKQHAHEPDTGIGNLSALENEGFQTGHGFQLGK